MTTRIASAALAPHRTSAHTATRFISTRGLIDDLMTVSRCLLLSVPDLTKGDRQFLYDVMRDEARFPVRGLQRLLDISRRSARPAHREKMAELLRTYCIPADESMDVVAASIAETQAQGQGDVAVHVFLFDRTAAHRAEALDRMSEHMACVRRLLDVVGVTPVHN